MAIVVAGVLGTVSGSGANPVGDATPASTGPGCHTLAVHTCVLPFPSDQFSVADPGAPTGSRPSVPAELCSPGVFEQLPPSFQAETFFASADGFSPLGAVSFETTASVDEDALAADPQPHVSAVDRTTGEPLPVLVDVPADGDGRILRIWPRARWPFGHRVTVSLSAALPSGPGTPIDRPAGWTREGIPATAFSPDDTLTTTTFTVRSEGDVRDDTAAMARAAWEADHPERNITVAASLLPHVRAVIQGQVRLTDFPTAAGEIDQTGPGAPRTNWVDFEVFYPERPMRARGAPVVLYGHGVGIVKESALLVALDNAERGWATVSIDQPNHGERREAEGGLLDLIEPGSLGRVTSMVMQSSIDFVSLQKAIIYQGTSMGGVLGAAFLSITPEPIPVAMLQIPGVGVSHIITNSILWNAVLGFQRVVPDAATAGEASALMGAAQMALDQGDAGNWIDVAVANGTRIMIDYGLRDGVAPNESTERLLEIAGISLAEPVTEPVAHLSPQPSGRAASARSAPAAPGAPPSSATQVPSSAPNPFVEGILGHLAFLQPEAVAAQNRWMDDVDRMFRD